MSVSWDTYIESLLTSGKISEAAILGIKGGVWAKSKGFELSVEEQRDIISFFPIESSDGAKETPKAGTRTSSDAQQIKTGAGSSAPDAKQIKTGAGSSAPDAKPVKTGVRLANEKYIKLTAMDDTITFRKGSDGAHFVTTEKAIIVAIYKQPTQAQEALAVVDHYARYLRSTGY